MDDTPAPTAPPPASPAGSPPADTPFLGGRGFDLLMGLGVLLISVVSLVVAVSANRTQERMLAASVWPSLMYGTSNISSEGEPQIALDLLNRGIGPARIRWAEITYRDRPLRNLRELMKACCGHTGEVGSFTSGLQRRVLGADEWIQIVRVPREGLPDPLWEQLDAARHDVRLRACFCSVLDDCWLFDSTLDDAEPADRCPAPPPVLWGT
jgi:hypothetical protein